jgi:hypothetical protein
MTLVVMSLIIGCKDEDDPFPFEKQIALLAGNENGSKSWVLELLTFNGVVKPVNDCEGDDQYIFYNNDSQQFTIAVGAQKCDAAEPAILEEGAWMIARDGKTIIIATNEVNATKLVSFFGLARAATILELTETTFKMEMNVVKDGDAAIISLSFKAK